MKTNDIYMCSHCERRLSAVDAAKALLAQEEFDAEVEKQKERLAQKRSWLDFFPYTIKIERKYHEQQC